MYLYRLKIEGFRRLYSTELFFSNATFLIGANNVGKSSVFKALEYLLNGGNKQKMLDIDFFSIEAADGKNQPKVDKVTIEAEFRDVPQEYLNERGFKGRLLPYENTSKDETGLSVTLKKTFPFGGEVVIEVLSKKRAQKNGVKDAKTIRELIAFGIDEETLKNILEIDDVNKNITKPMWPKIEEIEELNDFLTEDAWEKNPGGFFSIFVSRLPRFIDIPAIHSLDSLKGDKGPLNDILKIIFSDIRESSENYRKASELLDELAKEMDPKDTDKDFGKLMSELNSGFGGIFPGAKLKVSVDLSDPNKSITPTFNVQAASNIATAVDRQGTGLSRSAVFNLLKYHAEWNEKRSSREGKFSREIIIGFEEPELYLHPSASILIRDFIYDLCSTGAVQIICTTHSTAMMDLSRDKCSQVINHMKLKTFKNEQDEEIFGVASTALNHSDSFEKLSSDDKSYVRMLLRIDDSVAKAMFSDLAVIVEGDTEEIVFRETIRRLSSNERRTWLSKTSLINARGKATILPLVNYLKMLGLKYNVMHDKDTGKHGAESINDKIQKSVCKGTVVTPLENCIEDILGYTPPTKDKPTAAFKYISEKWGNDFSSVPENWRKIFSEISN